MTTHPASGGTPPHAFEGATTLTHSRTHQQANATPGCIHASLAINALCRGLLDEIEACEIAAALAIAAVLFSGGTLSIEQGGAYDGHH